MTDDETRGDDTAAWLLVVGLVFITAFAIAAISHIRAVDDLAAARSRLIGGDSSIEDYFAAVASSAGYAVAAMVSFVGAAIIGRLDRRAEK